MNLCTKHRGIMVVADFCSYCEIESLRQQLTEASQEIERKMHAGQFVLEQLAAALAACEMKDAALSLPCDYWNKTQFEIVKRALAIKPDASALKAHDEALIVRCANAAHEQWRRETDVSPKSAILELKGTL